MGFSLKLFIEELEDTLNLKDISDHHKLILLNALIEIGKKYAQECNQL